MRQDGLQVLVGGSGALGKVMQRALVDRGFRVRVVDRVQSPPPAEAQKGQVEYVRHALAADPVDSLAAALEGADTVFSMVTPDVQRASAQAFRLTNQVGVRQLCDTCEQVGVKSLVYVSSIAVTNHFIDSVEQTEADPLPPLDTYVSPYDMSKRAGEEMVLSRNSGAGLSTTALRLGGLLAGPTDYTCRSFFQMPGRVVSPHSAKIDFIGAPDFCRALMLAAESLAQPQSAAAGEAIFVTKSRSSGGSAAPTVHALAAEAAALIGWPYVRLPDLAMRAIIAGTWAADSAVDALQAFSTTFSDAKPGGMEHAEGGPPGIAPHLFMTIPQYEQTFNNAKANAVLGFEPQQTWEEVLADIVDEWKRQGGGAN